MEVLKVVQYKEHLLEKVAEDRGLEPRRVISPADFKSAALPIRLVLLRSALIYNNTELRSNLPFPGGGCVYGSRTQISGW